MRKFAQGNRCAHRWLQSSSSLLEEGPSQVRRKGRHVAGTFVCQKDAAHWALEGERKIGGGLDPKSPDSTSVSILSRIVELHIADHLEIGQKIKRSKAAVLETLKSSLGSTRITDLCRYKLIEYAKMRTLAWQLSK